MILVFSLVYRKECYGIWVGKIDQGQVIEGFIFQVEQVMFNCIGNGELLQVFEKGKF